MSGLKLSTANISPTDAAGLTSIFCAFDLSFCGTAYSLATSKYMYFLFAKDLLSQKKYIAVKYHHFREEVNSKKLLVNRVDTLDLILPSQR